MIQKFKMGRTLGGVGPQKPIEGWLDLSSNGPPLTLADGTLGFHDYSTDIATGIPNHTGNTTVARDVNGLYFTSVPTNQAAIGSAIIRPMACSLQHDPYFEWIIHKEVGMTLGLFIASEEFGDSNVRWWTQARRSFWWQSNDFEVCVRAETSLWVNSYTNSGWFRVRLDHNDGGVLSIYQLVSGDPSDWEGGTLVDNYYVSRDKPVVGGNLLTPGIGAKTLAEWGSQRVRAVKTTMRLR